MSYKNNILIALFVSFLLFFAGLNSGYAITDPSDNPDINKNVIDSNVQTSIIGKASLVKNSLKERLNISDNLKSSLAEKFVLKTAKGNVFHRTSNQVQGLETIDVGMRAIQIYTWNEVDKNNHTNTLYAISQGGGKIKGRIRNVSKTIRLKNRIFEPSIDDVPEVSDLIKSRQGNKLQLVQTLTVPLPEYGKIINRLGGKVLDYIPENTLLVDIDSSLVDKINALPWVRWVGPYHPAYRMEPSFIDILNGVADDTLPIERYSIVLCEKSPKRQENVARLIEFIGGQVDLIEPAGLRVEATLTQAQLVEIINSDDVVYVDLWGGPGESDMDIVRQVGGGDYIETLHGWSGQGVNGEIFDGELLTTHQEWGGNAPLIHSTGTTHTTYHGTSCFSINFATGTEADARGMVPDGQGIFFRYTESSQFGGATSRYTINEELTDPAGIYRAVFQTSSVGSTRTTEYTSISVEVDDYLFNFPILSTQSQSNAGTQMSRPQAWAKNIVSVGAFYHHNTATRTDDCWDCGPSGMGSIGPAADGRIKPDLSYFYDGIYAARGSADDAYTEFGGTSAATPVTAGHFGILFQMWHEGVWEGHGGGAAPFDSRPQMATAKALMINTAYRYDWTAGGANSDINRYVQGWGTADLQNLNDRAPVTSIIDETDLLQPLETNTYEVDVEAGQDELNVTMVYTDPAGVASAAIHRINDLSLRVTSPGGTVYWGNNGLTDGNFSTPGGTSNTIDTVENVFIQNPDEGIWTVDVIGDEIVEDSHLETPETDADYGLVISGGLIVEQESAPLPDFAYTYSYASHTRGYWFTAPTDFVITGLRVPDEAAHGSQNIEVVRFNPGVTPPTYTASTNSFTSLFRSVGEPSTNIVETAIVIHQGDVIGILGACGDSSRMYNSYGAAPFVSEIAGQPVTFARLGMQHNLASSPAQDLWTTSASYIARVEMYYETPEEIALPDYTYTYSYASHTRGYWFTAPVDFSITGLQVPDETANGLQNIQVIRFNPGVTPPAYSATTNSFTTLFRATVVSSGTIVDTLIEVNAGDVIGILGACGDSTMMYNSYGTGPFNTEIGGQSVTLQRLGMQHNLASTPAQDVWTNISNIGRIKMFVFTE